ncbi:SDR family oxidoreductase [Micromonospora echinospora]
MSRRAPRRSRSGAAELGDAVAVGVDLSHPDAAVDLAAAGIRVNAVAPGPVQTGWITDDLVDQVRAIVPLGRVGEPADVADAVVFLASHQARWVTGQVLQVAGGHAL